MDQHPAENNSESKSNWNCKPTEGCHAFVTSATRAGRNDEVEKRKSSRENYRKRNLRKGSWMIISPFVWLRAIRNLRKGSWMIISPFVWLRAIL
ncbi:hypothetical protein DITRI_Ditri01bG0203400 [Diplodiscus trichospermus]